MSEQADPMAYIARKPCGCFVFAGVDLPERQNDNAKEIAWCVRHGHQVERVTCQFVRDNWRSSCDVCTAPAASPMQMELAL